MQYHGVTGPTRRYALLVFLLVCLAAVPTALALRAGSLAIDADRVPAITPLPGPVLSNPVAVIRDNPPLTESPDTVLNSPPRPSRHRARPPAAAPARPLATARTRRAVPDESAERRPLTCGSEGICGGAADEERDRRSERGGSDDDCPDYRLG